MHIKNFPCLCVSSQSPGNYCEQDPSRHVLYRCTDTKEPYTYRWIFFLINKWNHNIHLILYLLYNRSCHTTSGHLREREHVKNYATTIGMNWWSLFTWYGGGVWLVRSHCRGDPWVLFVSTVHTPVCCNKWLGWNTFCIGPSEGLPVSSNPLGWCGTAPMGVWGPAHFFWSWCLESPRLCWNNPSSLLADGILSMAVFPSCSTWDSWDSSMPHAGPGHPEAPP